MTVKDLREELEQYNDAAEVVIVDWSNGREHSLSIGSDEQDEFTEYCRIGLE